MGGKFFLGSCRCSYICLVPKPLFFIFLMNLPFESLSPQSKIWIYQSEQSFSASEQEVMAHRLEKFLNTWASHGSEMLTGYTFKHQKFIIVGIDESMAGASGCSVDKLMQFMQAMGNQLQLNLIDRSIAYVEDEQIKICQFSQIKHLVAQGVIHQDTPIFNTFITRKSELSNNWIVKASETWTSRYFKPEAELA